MTDAIVLADALCDAGILEKSRTPGLLPCYVYQVTGHHNAWQVASVCINLWEVAGKVLESMDVSITRSGSGFACTAGGEWIASESLPQAIIETWYGARN